MNLHRFGIALLALSAFASSPQGVRAADTISNWPVPSSSGRSALVDLTGPLPFIAVAPCRLVDTRGNGAPLSGGFMAGSTSRSYVLAGTGTCGIPLGAAAISVNLTVTETAGPGFVQLFPTGGSAGGSSTVNYVANQTVTNAAIVPLSPSGAITVSVGVSGTQVIIDTNGYFGTAPAGDTPFRIFNSSNSASVITRNTSTSCVGACGINTVVDSAQSAAIAIAGRTNSNLGTNYGVYGNAHGTSVAPGPPGMANYAAGVVGIASNTGGNTAGVIGETLSASATAGGVLGVAHETAANGGLFVNDASNTSVALAFGPKGGLYTNGDSVIAANLNVTGALSSSAPHPQDASRQISYVSVEAPTSDVYFRGTGQLANGVARIDVPDHFRFSAREDSYMTTLTAVGARSSLYVESQGPDGIVVRGTGDGAFSYVVFAEREIARDHQPIQANVDFTPDAIAKGASARPMDARVRARLVRNGTLNADGTFNTATARRLGWTIPAAPAPVPVVIPEGDER